MERPLREYQSKSREMQGISTIQGNLGALAKELDQAHQKMEKLRGKGTRSDTSRISSAQTNVNTAMQQWDSQAPFVYEQLQALDEHRVNHLRDALTQLQTHEIDQLERSRASAESALNALLNVDTSDEISTFVARTQGSGGPPSLLSPRTANRPSTSNATNATTPVSPATPLSSRRNNTSSNPAPSVSVDDEHETVPTPRLQTPGEF